MEAPQLAALFRKGWPRVAKAVFRAPVVSAKIVSEAIPAAERELLNDDEFNGCAVVVLALGQMLGKPMATDTITSGLIQILHGRLKHAAGERRFDYGQLSGKERQAAKRVAKDVRRKAGISPRLGARILYEMDDRLAVRWRDAFEFLFDGEGVAEAILDDALLDEDSLEEIAAIYNMCFTADSFGQSDSSDENAHLVEFTVAAIYIKRLVLAYKQVKQTFWANTGEVLYPELNNLTQEVSKLREERTRLAQENAALREQSVQTQKLAYSEYNRARAEGRDAIHQLSAEVGQLRAQVEADRRELAALRELFFDLSAETNVVAMSSETDPAPYLAKLRGVRGVIAGGHERWQQRIRALLPHFTFIHTDVLNFDPQLFAGADVVFVHSGYVSHGFYYKVMSALRSFPDVILHYLHDTTPLRTLKEMSAAVGGMR
jgi:FtsZ-binding cell division protein ZapB